MDESITINEQIYVRSHVARDLLQNAALFSTDKLVVWEYVSNGLEYIDEGTHPVVHVKIDKKKKRIVVSDNGRGMDWGGLKNFFVMHGENIDRLQGRPGRGRFGTGKSAAFGIADILRLTTVRNRKLSIVELKRSEIEAMNSEDPIPIRNLKKEESTNQPNGTVIEIENIHLKTLNQSGIIRYIERHLEKWKNATVFVNNYECEVTEPPIVDKKIFYPDPIQIDKLGDIELILKIAGEPLDSDDYGVSIFSNGVWHETTAAGHEGREMIQYIFGEIDVPRLDEDKSPIPPFDLSRSMKLNPSNELVLMIYSFIGEKIDVVRRELLKAERKRKESEDAKKLAKQADEIAQVINDDFQEFRLRLSKAKAKSGTGFDYGPDKNGVGSNNDDFIFGNIEPAIIIEETGDMGSKGENRTGGDDPRTLNPKVSQATDDSERLGKWSGGKGRRTISKGGFRVEFKPMGKEGSRALYISNERTIYVNLDHPQLIAARGNKSFEDSVFQRLAYEVAFSEYCIALAHELDQRNEFIDTSDPIVSIRESINRLARKAAQLFAV